MKRIAFYLSLVLVVLVLASCKKGQKNLFTPTSSGRPYEVLVVVNRQCGIAPQDVHYLMCWIRMFPDYLRQNALSVFQISLPNTLTVS